MSMSVRGAAFLGIGAMVGAGIFALLGEAAVVAGSAVWAPARSGGEHRRSNLVYVSQDTGRTWHYVDPTNHGADFTYQARVIDAAANVGNSDSQAVTINDPAAAYDDAVATTENTIVTADVFADNGSVPDSDPDGFSASYGGVGRERAVGTTITLPRARC